MRKTLLVTIIMLFKGKEEQANHLCTINVEPWMTHENERLKATKATEKWLKESGYYSNAEIKGIICQETILSEDVAEEERNKTKVYSEKQLIDFGNYMMYSKGMTTEKVKPFDLVNWQDNIIKF